MVVSLVCRQTRTPVTFPHWCAADVKLFVMETFFRQNEFALRSLGTLPLEASSRTLRFIAVIVSEHLKHLVFDLFLRAAFHAHFPLKTAVSGVWLQSAR